MYEIRVASEAKSLLKKLKIAHKQVIGQVFKDLMVDPYIGKPLVRNYAGKYSYRIGVYRIIYKINEKEKVVEILSAGHRSVVYN